VGRILGCWGSIPADWFCVIGFRISLLRGIYWDTNRILSNLLFGVLTPYRGTDGSLGLGVRGPGGSGFVGEVCGTAKLGPATGEAGGFDRPREGQEQEADHFGDGGVVLGGKTAGLAVEVVGDCYGDVADSLHVLICLVARGISSMDSVRREGEIICKRARGKSILTESRII